MTFIVEDTGIGIRQEDIKVESVYGKGGRFLVDIYMPEINEIEFVKKLNQNPKHKTTPVIFVTSESDIEIAIAVITSDIVGYVKSRLMKTF